MKNSLSFKLKCWFTNDESVYNRLDRNLTIYRVNGINYEVFRWCGKQDNEMFCKFVPKITIYEIDKFNRISYYINGYSFAQIELGDYITLDSYKQIMCAKSIILLLGIGTRMIK